MIQYIKNHFREQKFRKEREIAEAKAARVLEIEEDIKITNSNIRYLNASLNTLKATAVYARGVDASETKQRRETLKRNIEIQERQLKEETFNLERLHSLL